MYYAKVRVPNYPDAEIYYKGYDEGKGEVSFKVPRRDADKFTVVIQKKGCLTETRHFVLRQFRGWSFLGTLVTFTGITKSSGIPLPFGVAVDGATGAWWKPDINEKGVSKEDYKHYMYRVDYTGCSTDTTQYVPIKLVHQDFSSKVAKLKELKSLYDQGVLTKEDYEKEKQKVLDAQ